MDIAQKGIIQKTLPKRALSKKEQSTKTTKKSGTKYLITILGSVTTLMGGGVLAACGSDSNGREVSPAETSIAAQPQSAGSAASASSGSDPEQASIVGGDASGGNSSDTSGTSNENSVSSGTSSAANPAPNPAPNPASTPDIQPDQPLAQTPEVFNPENSNPQNIAIQPEEEMEDFILTSCIVKNDLYFMRGKSDPYKKIEVAFITNDGPLRGSITSTRQGVFSIDSLRNTDIRKTKAESKNLLGCEVQKLSGNGRECFAVQTEAQIKAQAAELREAQTVMSIPCTGNDTFAVLVAGPPDTSTGAGDAGQNPDSGPFDDFGGPETGGGTSINIISCGATISGGRGSIAVNLSFERPEPLKVDYVFSNLTVTKILENFFEDTSLNHFSIYEGAPPGELVRCEVSYTEGNPQTAVFKLR